MMPRRRSSTWAPVALPRASRGSVAATASSVPDAGGRRIVHFGSSVEQLAYAGDDRAAEELDRGSALVLRDASDGVVQVEPAQAERADDCGDPIGDGLGGADVHRAVVDLGEELLVGRRAPAALARRPLELLLVVGPLDLDRLAIGLGDETERVQPDRQLWLSVLQERSLVELDVGCE